MPFMNKPYVCILRDTLQFNIINVTFFVKKVIVIILSVFLGGSTSAKILNFKGLENLTFDLSICMVWYGILEFNVPLNTV